MTNNSTLPLFEKPTAKTPTGFEQYDRQHPAVWRRFEAMALADIHAGKKRLSAKRLFEMMRLSGTPQRGDFFINNNFTADYARKFMWTYPMFEGMFETRERRLKT
jgi:hypothetical protein